MTSTRLPGKILMEAVGKPMLELMVERLKRCETLDGIIIATTTNATDDPVVTLADRLGVGCFRGSEFDVLARVLGAAKEHGAEVIVQVPGDCPLVDPALVDQCVTAYRQSDVDYASNALSKTFPMGTEANVFATALLEAISNITDDPSDREHVTLYIYSHPETYRLLSIEAPADIAFPDVKLTLDTPEDFTRIQDVFDALYAENPEFSLHDTLSYIGVPRS